jgi:hypothetical protein
MMIRPKPKFWSGVVLIYTTLLAMAVPRSAEAIIFLPAIVLIPIANILVVLIGGLTAPFAAIAAIFSKIFHIPLKKALAITLIVLFLVALSVVIFLKLQNPDRPWW